MHYIKTLYSFFWCACWVFRNYCSPTWPGGYHGGSRPRHLGESGGRGLEKVAAGPWDFGGCVGQKYRGLLEIWDRILEDIKHDFNLQKWEVVE